MLSRLNIRTDVPIRTERRCPKVDQLRAAIVTYLTKHPSIVEDEKRIINFRPPPPYFILPTILYGQPPVGKPYFSMFGYGTTGRELLRKISLLLAGVTIRVGDQSYKIVRATLEREMMPSAPRKVRSPLPYFTLSPIIFFDKRKEHGQWHAITMNYKESDPARYDKEMKTLISRMIKYNIYQQLRSRVGPGEYPITREIDIQISDFRFFGGKYHKEQRNTPMLFVSFTSSHELPMFIGHHTGKGYGQLQIDKKRQEGRAVA